jgi:hypothetical protein
MLGIDDGALQLEEDVEQAASRTETIAEETAGVVLALGCICLGRGLPAGTIVPALTEVLGLTPIEIVVPGIKVVLAPVQRGRLLVQGSDS